MSLIASLLKGKAVDSSLDSIFKNSAGPVAKTAPIAAKVRQPFPEDLPEEPKKKVKTPKPKSTPVSKKQKASAKESDDEDNLDMDIDDEDEDEAASQQNAKKNKKKDSVESKYEAKVATKDTKKARNAAPKVTQELIKQQTKHEYGEGIDEEESKVEDLVHESLRGNNKRKASTTDGVEEKETKSKKSKSTKASDKAKEDSDDSDDDDETDDKNAKKDDPERQERTVFVGNLAVSSIAQADFRKLKSKFKEFGPIESIRFRSVAFSELLPRKIAFITGKLHPERDVVNAYIVFKNKDSVAKAVKAMNGQLFLNKHIRVDTVDGSKKHQPKKSVFVGNLAFDAQEEDLWNFFKDSGDVENVRIIRDRKTNLGKGFAYVQFQDRASVDVALRLHETKLGTRKLRVVRCKRLEEEDNQTNGMGSRSTAGVNKSGKDALAKGKKPVKGQHAPIKMDGAAKRLAFKSRKANERHVLSKKKSGAIVEGERSQKGAKVDLGIKKGKAKVKANVPKKKVVKK